MKVRPATYEDTFAIARVLVDTFLATNRGLMPEAAWQRRKEEWTYAVSARSWEETLQEIAQGDSPATCLFVAEDETVGEAGDVVGFAYGCRSKDDKDPQDVGEIDVLYVREEKQRQGFGRALCQVAATHLAQAGMTKLHICTPADHTQGRLFYEKLGGRVVGTRDDYEDGELCVLVLYEWPDIRVLANLDAQAAV